MKTYILHIAVTAGAQIEVQADSPEEAAEKFGELTDEEILAATDNHGGNDLRSITNEEYETVWEAL